MSENELSVKMNNIKSDIDYYEKLLTDYPNKKLILNPLSEEELSVLWECVTFPIDNNDLFDMIRQRVYELTDELTKLKGDN